MTDPSVPGRADARRNQRALLDAAAAVFVEAGVDAPVRAVAARAGVGMGTIYRHFPTRADLIVAVFRHQVEELVTAGPALSERSRTPFDALQAWIELFVDFLVTKHGLPGAMAADAGPGSLHAYFLDRLVPVCTGLLAAAATAGQLRADIADIDGLQLMRAVGNLCFGADDGSRYDAPRMVHVLLDGLRRPGD